MSADELNDSQRLHRSVEDGSKQVFLGVLQQRSQSDFQVIIFVIIGKFSPIAIFTVLVTGYAYIIVVEFSTPLSLLLLKSYQS